SLTFEINILCCKASDVSTGAREARYKPNTDWIANGAHHNWDRFACLLGSYRRRRAPCDNDFHRQFHQLRRQIGIAVVVAFCEPRLQAQVFTFHVAILSQFANNPLDRRQWLRREYSDDMHCFLRLRRERPRGGRAAEQRDELTPPDHSITSSASASSLSGIVRSSAFA